jgi:hypothetical protein
MHLPRFLALYVTATFALICGWQYYKWLSTDMPMPPEMQCVSQPKGCAAFKKIAKHKPLIAPRMSEILPLDDAPAVRVSAP